MGGAIQPGKPQGVVESLAAAGNGPSRGFCYHGYMKPSQHSRDMLGALLDQYRQAVRSIGTAEEQDLLDDTLVILSSSKEAVARRLQQNYSAQAWPWWREALFSADRDDLIDTMKDLGHTWGREDYHAVLTYDAPRCQEALLRPLTPAAIRSMDRTEGQTLLVHAFSYGRNDIVDKMLHHWPGFAHNKARDDLQWYVAKNQAEHSSSYVPMTPTCLPETDPHRIWKKRTANFRTGMGTIIQQPTTAWTLFLQSLLRDISRRAGDAGGKIFHSTMSEMSDWLGERMAGAPPWVASQVVEMTIGCPYDANTAWSYKLPWIVRMNQWMAPLWATADPEHGWLHVKALCVASAMHQRDPLLLQSVAKCVENSAMTWTRQDSQAVLELFYDELLKEKNGRPTEPPLHLGHPVWKRLPWVAEEDWSWWNEAMAALQQTSNAAVNAYTDGQRTVWRERCLLEKEMLGASVKKTARVRI